MKKGRLTGKLLSGRFKLEELLEGGQSGEIYEAADLAGSSRATVVLFSGGPTDEPERLEALSRGIQDLFGMTHLNLGAIISQHLTTDSRRKGEPPYLAFAEQDGIPLDDYVREVVPLKPEMAAFILLQVSGAMEALHEKGIRHGGLSASRVRVRPEHLLHDDYVKVHLPVVSSTLLSSTIALLEEDETLTAEETARLPYAAPESLLDEEPSPSADIYSTGALLYLCLTGQPPLPEDVQDASPAEAKDALLFDGPTPITEVNPDLPQDLLHLVTRCLAKDQDERPQSIADRRKVLGRHAPKPAVTGCEVIEEPNEAATGSDVPPAPPRAPVPTPVAISLGDAQREATLRRQPVPEAEPPPTPPPPADLQLDNFDTIAMPAAPKMQEPEVETRSDAHPDEDSEDLDPDDFTTIAMPSPFKKEALPPAPPEKVTQPAEAPQPDLQPAGEQAEDFSTVLLSMEELEQEAAPAITPAPHTPEELEPDRDLEDAMFNSVELSREDLDRMKEGDGES